MLLLVKLDMKRRRRNWKKGRFSSAARLARGLVSISVITDDAIAIEANCVSKYTLHSDCNSRSLPYPSLPLHLGTSSISLTLDVGLLVPA